MSIKYDNAVGLYENSGYFSFISLSGAEISTTFFQI